MTLSNIYTLLNSIPQFEDKVAYYAFPIGEAPELPFICYLVVGTENFRADESVYKVINEVDIELYTKNKDIVSERAIEKALSDNSIVWDKDESYLKDESCFMVTYTIFTEGD